MIEAAAPLHATLLAALHAMAFAPHDRWDAQAMHTLLEQPGVFGLIDDAGGMVLARVVADEAEILTLAVAPPARRQGVGRGLLAAAAGIAAAHGAQTLFLEVADNNAAARALYEREGFRQAGRRRRYYPDGADALVMRCALTPCATAGG